MNIDQHGETCSFAEVPAGTAFRFGLRGDRFIALKVFDRRLGQEPVPLCAVLAPGHPGYEEEPRPGIFTASVVERYPVFAMPEMRFVASQDAEDWLIGSGQSIDAGDVLLTPTRTMLAVASNHDIVRVDIASGEIVREHHELPIVVKRWSLVLLQFDEPKVLFERGK